jgi:hypothetical protein
MAAAATAARGLRSRIRSLVHCVTLQYKATEQDQTTKSKRTGMQKRRKSAADGALMSDGRTCMCTNRSYLSFAHGPKRVAKHRHCRRRPR